MFKRIVVVAALLLSAPAAFADAPGKGAFGLGLSLSGNPINSQASVAPGFQAMYWATDQVDIQGRFGLATINNGGTVVNMLVGGDYFFVKNPRENFGVLVGAALGVNVLSPANANSTTQFVMTAGPGMEYYFSKHFGLRINEGIAFNTEPTTFAFVSRIDFNWWF